MKYVLLVFDGDDDADDRFIQRFTEEPELRAAIGTSCAAIAELSPEEERELVDRRELEWL